MPRSKGNPEMAKPDGATERSAGERSEPARSAVAPSDRPVVEGAVLPETEVSSRPTRRRFTAEYKARIVREAGLCSEKGAIGALLRREGLYSSHLVTWRHLRDQGEIAGLTPKKRGPKAEPSTALRSEIEQLKKRNAKLEARLKHAEAIIDIQKKVAAMLGIPLNHPETEGDES